MGQIQGALVGIAMDCRRYSYRWPSLAVLLVLSISVLYYHCFSNGAVGTGGVDPTPALCATMLKPIAKGDHGEVKKASSAGLTACSRRARTTTRQRRRYSAQYGALPGAVSDHVVGMAYLFVRLPSSFLPDEARAYL